LDEQIKSGTCSETEIFHCYPRKFVFNLYMFVHKRCPYKWRFVFVMCHAFRQLLFRVGALGLLFMMGVVGNIWLSQP